jgi:integrase
MQAQRITLDEAIEEYIEFRVETQKPNTVSVNRRGLAVWKEALGPGAGAMHTWKMDATHGQKFVKFMGRKPWKLTTKNAHKTTVRGFIEWCHGMGYLPPAANPMFKVKNDPIGRSKRQRVDGVDFEALLDSAHLTRRVDGKEVTVHGTPHERILTAIGLFLMLRQGEIVKGLRIKDVYLDATPPYIEATIYKTTKDEEGEVDQMPVCRELERELRRWLTWYANDVMDTLGPLQGDWYLVPRRAKPTLANDGSGPGGGYPVPREKGNCLPTLVLTRPHRLVQSTLQRHGIPTRDPVTGKSYAEGLHTLRRSGARALFEELKSDESYDGAMRTVMDHLHHKSQATTEKYLGMDRDRNARNKRLGGRFMFKANEPGQSDNVVPLHKPEAEAN